MTLRKTFKILLFATSILLMIAAVAWISISVYISESKPSYKLKEELYGYHYGKDYRGHVGYGQFQLWHAPCSDVLCFATSPTSLADVLQCEYDHCFDDNRNLYFYAADGYAVVYAQANIAKVLIVDPPPELVQGDRPKLDGMRKPENNYQIERLEGEEFKNIVYLDSYDDFTDAEKEQLDKLRKNVERTDKLFDAGLGYIEIAEKIFG